MELLNEMYKAREQARLARREWEEAQDIYLRMLAPVCAAHRRRTVDRQLGKPYSIHHSPGRRWTRRPPRRMRSSIPVQVNGKVRDRIIVPADASEEAIKAAALASEGSRNTWKARATQGHRGKQAFGEHSRLVLSGSP